MNNFIKVTFFVSIVLCLVSCQPANPTKQTTVIRPNIQQYVTVTRTPASNIVTFTFSRRDNWRIYTLDENEKVIDFTTTSASVISIRVKDATTRYYFRVMNSRNESAIVAETVLPIQGQPNFRDLGGLVTMDGYSLKWGRLFRSGALHGLNAADRAYMKSAGIEVDIDFRTKSELVNADDSLPIGVRYINYPISTPPSPDNINKWVLAKDAIALDTMFIPLYRSLVNDESCKIQYTRFLQQLRTGKATVYHCSAGKDRTGFATVILLSALGVDRQAIISNYLETNQYISTAANVYVENINNQYKDKRGELLRRSLMVNYEYIKTSLNIIDKMPGGMTGYLKNILKIDVEILKSEYLDNYKKK
jgi:protein-tyrosine phosphatase